MLGYVYIHRNALVRTVVFAVRYKCTPIYTIIEFQKENGEQKGKSASKIPQPNRDKYYVLNFRFKVNIFERPLKLRFN